jgi:drug/metabolite transporter (DMT)-like permease
VGQVRGGAAGGRRALGTSDTLRRVDRARLTGIALVVISAIAFGSGGLFARPVYATGVDWLTLMAWRFGIAGALAWALLLAQPRARRALRALPRRALLVSIGLGVWYVTNTATYYAGIATVPLGLAALIVYIYPPVVAVLALRLGRPLEGRRAWTALAIALLGVALALGGIDAATAPPIEGLLLIIAAPLFYSVWIIMAARHSGERSDHTGHEAVDGAATSVIGAVMLSATAAVYWTVNLAIGHPVLPPDIPGDAWPGIVAVALVAGFVPMQAFYAGAQRVGAAQASLISTVEPLWTIVAAALLFDERLQPVQLAGGALILAGVLLSQTRGRRHSGAGNGTAGEADADQPPLPQPMVRLGEE